MSNKYKFPITKKINTVIVCLLVFIGTYWFIGVHSVAAAKVTYPIPDLGFCRDAQECYYYCEIPQNQPTCWSYGKYVVGTQVLGETDNGETTTSLEEKGVDFPIIELGNCTSAQQCFEYCATPQNQIACKIFAEKHNLRKSAPGELDTTETALLLDKAKTQLGCSSQDSCRALCETNRDRCQLFMKNHGPARLKATYQQRQVMLEKAEGELGCGNEAACKQFCQDPQNAQKCSRFADQHASVEYRQKKLELIKKAKSELGCNSSETCLKFCELSENATKCSQFTARQNSSTGKYEIPSSMPTKGCTSEAECRARCQENPTACPGFKESTVPETKLPTDPRYAKPLPYQSPYPKSPSYPDQKSLMYETKPYAPAGDYRPLEDKYSSPPPASSTPETNTSL